DFLDVVPRRDRREAVREVVNLARGEVRGCSSAEIDEIERPARDRWSPAVQVPFVHQEIVVVDDLLRVLVRVDAEIAEMAPLPEEGDVETQPGRHAAGARSGDRRERIAGYGVQRPD